MSIAICQCESMSIAINANSKFFRIHFLHRCQFFNKNCPYAVYSFIFSSSPFLKFALRESGCRIGYELTKMSRDHFWRSISSDNNMEVSALSPIPSYHNYYIANQMASFPETVPTYHHERYSQLYNSKTDVHRNKHQQ